ncbi:MAG: hypothetical protein IH905_14355 [Proteobacteria bacterium]|nr:hypothetical protein [Pseudomonadota bacterium]
MFEAEGPPPVIREERWPSALSGDPVRRCEDIHCRKLRLKYRCTSLSATSVELAPMMPLGPGPQCHLDRVQIGHHPIALGRRRGQRISNGWGLTGTDRIKRGHLVEPWGPAVQPIGEFHIIERQALDGYTGLRLYGPCEAGEGRPPVTGGREIQPTAPPCPRGEQLYEGWYCVDLRAEAALELACDHFKVGLDNSGVAQRLHQRRRGLAAPAATDFNLQLDDYQSSAVSDAQQIDLADASVCLCGLERYLVVEQAKPAAIGTWPTPPQVDERDCAVLLEAVAASCRGRHAGMPDEVLLANERAARRAFA